MKKLLFGYCGAFLFLLLAAPSSRAEVTIVLTLDGISGESSLPSFEGGIDIANVSFSIEQLGVGKEASKTGAGAAKATFQPIVMSKGADASSPAIFLRSIFGTPIAKAKITFLEPDLTSSSPVLKEFFSITLGNVFITKYGVAASRGDSNTEEEVVLNYNKILTTYTPATGPVMTKGFDLVKNKEINAIP